MKSPLRMTGRRVRVWALVWFLGSLLFPLRAGALIGDNQGVFGLNGSIRTFFFALDANRRTPFSGGFQDVLSQSVLRLTASGRPRASLTYEVHLVGSLTLSSAGAGQSEDPAIGASANSRYRFLDASWDALDEEGASSRIFFDRFNVKAALEWADITVGRQAITFGKAYFWNPLDVFFPFDSTQFDREYKPGVDALRVDFPLGPFSGINLVAAGGSGAGLESEGSRNPGLEDLTWYGSAFLARFFTHVAGWDLAFQGGKIFGGWQLGGGFVGDLGPIQVRGEAAQFWALKSDPLPFPFRGDLIEDHFLAVLGFGHRFENSLSVDLEYFFNGAGESGNLDTALLRTQLGSSLQLSRHLLGVLIRYEFTPIVYGQVAVIGSLSDGSAQTQPIVSISLSDEMELLVGAIVNLGKRPEEPFQTIPQINSEFGTFPSSVFFEWKYYF